jgi:hypothetical protein
MHLTALNGQRGTLPIDLDSREMLCFAEVEFEKFTIDFAQRMS